METVTAAVGRAEAISQVAKELLAAILLEGRQRPVVRYFPCKSRLRH